MANRIHHAVYGTQTEETILTGRLLGGGSGQTLTTDEDFQFASEVKTITRSSLGTFALVWRHVYPQTLALMRPVVVSSTVGLTAYFSAHDFAAGTSTLKVVRAGGATLPAWSSAIAVSSNTTGALSSLGAGWVTAVTITAGGVTGAGNLRSTAPATSRDIQVTYSGAGIPTLNTLAGDAVTEVVIQHHPLETLVDPATTDEIHLVSIVRNRSR